MFTINNEYNLSLTQIFTFHRKGSIITLSSLSLFNLSLPSCLFCSSSSFRMDNNNTIGLAELLVCLSFKTQFFSFLFCVLDYHQTRLDPPSFCLPISVLYRLFTSSSSSSSFVVVSVYNCCLYFRFLTSLYEVPTSRRDEDGLPPNERRLKETNIGVLKGESDVRKSCTRLRESRTSISVSTSRQKTLDVRGSRRFFLNRYVHRLQVRVRVLRRVHAT